MIIYTEFVILVTFLTVVGLADAVLVKNNSAILYPALIFGFHLPLVVLFAIGVYIVSYLKKKKKAKVIQVRPSTPVVPVPNRPKTPRVKSYVKVPSYWFGGNSLDGVDFVDLPTFDCRPIKILVYSLWEPDEVGIGRDATHLNKRHIRICKVTRIQNKGLYQKYIGFKKVMKRKENYIDYFEDLAEVAQRDKPVQTTELIQNTPELAQSYLEEDVNHTLNEHYLFHGTKSAKAEGVCRQGLSPFYAGTGLFGKGAYSADNLTKSDQYTDGTEIGNTLLLLRVCLGEIYVQRDTIDARSFTSPP